MEVLGLAIRTATLLGRSLEMEDSFDPIKEGPNLKPSSSKLGTCQGQHSLTLITLACETDDFERVWPPHESTSGINKL